MPKATVSPLDAQIDRNFSKYIYVCKCKCHKLTFWSVISTFFMIILLAMTYLLSKKDSTSQVTNMDKWSNVSTSSMNTIINVTTSKSLTTVKPLVDINANDTIVIVHTNGSGNSENVTLYSCDLFVDDQEQIYVADTLNRRILKLKGNSSILLMETLHLPISLSIDQQNNFMYISYYNYIIKYELYPNGTLVSSNGTTIISAVMVSSNDYYDEPTPTLNEISTCFNLFVLQTNGNLYVSDSKFARILLLIFNTREWIIVAGGNDQGSKPNQLNTPRGIFVDENETIYVADYANHRIQKWNKNGINGTTILGHQDQFWSNSTDKLYNPIGLLVLSNGDMIISDFGNGRRGRIRYWSLDSTIGKQTVLNDIYNPRGGQFEWRYNTGWQLDCKRGYLYLGQSWHQNSSVNTKITRFKYTQC